MLFTHDLSVSGPQVNSGITSLRDTIDDEEKNFARMEESKERSNWSYNGWNYQCLVLLKSVF